MDEFDQKRRERSELKFLRIFQNYLFKKSEKIAHN